MAKGKKELLESAPWRTGSDDDKFNDAKVKVTNNPGSTPTMHVPGNKNKKKKNNNNDYDDDDDSLLEIDPELRYSFHRNYQWMS